MSLAKKSLKKATVSSFPAQEVKRSGKWTEEEDILLQQIVPLYNERHWRKISQHMKGRSAIQCLHRWTKILKPGLVKGPWSIDEDNKLVTWVQEKGPIKWAQCAHLIPGRSGKQCRERWFNNLNPNVKKGDWTPEEDDLIFKLYVNYGSSWSKIAQHFKDRTENSIKNRFYSTIRKLYSDQKKLEKGKTLKKNLKRQSQASNSEGKLEETPSNPINNNNNSANNCTGTNDPTDFNTLFSKQEKCLTDTKRLTNAKSIINTLYDLLRTSNIEHPPHINKIYSSGIYKKTRRYRRKARKALAETPNLKDMKKIADESLKSITTKGSYDIKNEPYCSDSESDGNFENFLSSIEQTINKELILREIDSYRDFSLEELQKKICDFCEETPITLEQNAIVSNDLEKILNHHIEKEIVNGSASKNNEKILEKAIQEEIMMKCEDENQEESDKKMFFLVQQLQTLENMLTKTRQELMSLENSLQIPEKNANCLMGNEKEEEIFAGFSENIPTISDWNLYKRKASMTLEDFFDLPAFDAKKRKLNFMEEDMINEAAMLFKEDLH